MIHLLQINGLLGLGVAHRGKPSDMAALGRLTALGALLVSLLFWDSW
ncbi:hypothetical protein [Streptomyces olivochromogenes]